MCQGGSERYASVWNGLQRAGMRRGMSIIHDGARPFVDQEMIRPCI